MVVASPGRTVAHPRVARPLIAVLLAVMALIPAMHIAVITQPALDPTLGIFSAALAVVTGVSAAIGILLTPLLDRLGRVGAILFAVSVVFYRSATGSVSAITPTSRRAHPSISRSRSSCRRGTSSC